jgi:hypothetical protein
MAPKSKIMWLLEGPRNMWEPQLPVGRNPEYRGLHCTWPVVVRSTDDLQKLSDAVQRAYGDAPPTIRTDHGTAADFDRAVRDVSGGTNSITIESANREFSVTIHTTDGVESGRKFILMWGINTHNELSQSAPGAFERVAESVKACTRPFSRWEVLRGRRDVMVKTTWSGIQEDKRKSRERWVNAMFGVGGALAGAVIKTLFG